ncbi:MAG: winged helix-turn-helix domain-containing protein [bacterium]|nr:winged helix-turn-helix domain-containing protein [bacterium]
MSEIKPKTPEVSFIQSPEWQINYLCFLAVQIQAGFYRKKGFLVLPYPTLYSKTVYFPDLPYPSGFWKKLKKLSYHSVARLFPEKTRRELKTVLPFVNSVSPSPKLTGKVRFFLRTLKNMGFFIREIEQVSSLTILLTPFGTMGSFNYRRKKSGLVDLFLTHHSDSSSFYLAKTIILALLLLQNEKYAQEKWQDKQTIADFLLSSGRINGIFDSPPTNFSSENKKLPAKYLLDSKNFLRKLGMAGEGRLRVVDGQIFLGEKKIDRKLSPQEKKTLAGLLAKNGDVLSYDELAKILWGKEAEDRFSLWAMTKIIQKLRAKLTLLGLSDAIYTLYGRGYGLVV